MHRRGWCLLACIMMASGCMGAGDPDGTTGAESTVSATTTAPTAGPEPENETQGPAYVLLWEANLTVQVGHQAGCAIGPPGYFADAFTDGSSFQEVDYDVTPIDSAWVGAAANFTGRSTAEMVLVWLDETGGVVEATGVSPDETVSTEVPEGTYAAGFATCGPASGTGHLTVHESEAMFTRGQ